MYAERGLADHAGQALHPASTRTWCTKRSGSGASTSDVDELLHLDQLARKLQHEVDEAQARRKSFGQGVRRR